MSSNMFVSAVGTGDDPRSAGSDCLRQLGNLPENANVGFIYATAACTADFEDLIGRLQQETGIKNWVGTVGGGICAPSLEIYDEPAVTILIGHIPDQHFRLLEGVNLEGHNSLVDIREWSAQNVSNFAIVQGDPTNGYTPQLLLDLVEQLGQGFLVGGLSASDNDQLFPQVAGALHTGGVSGIVFSEAIPVATGLTQGCTPMDGRFIITECNQNIIAKIDGRPALDVFKESIGEVLARDLNRAAGYIFIGLPIAGSDRGDYLVRNLVGIDPENGLLAIGDIVHEGAPIIFCKRDTQTAEEDMLRMLRDLKKRTGGTPKAGLYFSCLGRGRYQFGENSEELKLIEQELGSFPLAGFFANGEISHDKLYGYTGVLALFL